MKIEITEQERRILLEALNKVPVQGLEVMQIVLALAAKIASAKEEEEKDSSS